MFDDFIVNSYGGSKNILLFKSHETLNIKIRELRLFFSKSGRFPLIKGTF